MFVFYIGVGGSSRGVVHATYRTNVYLRALVEEIHRLQNMGVKISAYYVDEYLTSFLCDNQDCRDEHGQGSRLNKEGRVEGCESALMRVYQ